MPYVTMEVLGRVIEAYSGAKRKKKETEMYFLSETYFNLMMLKINNGFMCHFLMENVLVWKMINLSVTLLALSHLKVTRPRTRRPEGGKLRTYLKIFKNLLRFKLTNIFPPLALSHLEVIRPKTRRPAGEN